jgi:hypothetical protein
MTDAPQELLVAVQRVQSYMNLYAEKYEFHGLPLTRRERSLVGDAINGLIADDEFVSRLVEAYRLRVEHA